MFRPTSGMEWPRLIPRFAITTINNMYENGCEQELNVTDPSKL